MNISFDDDQLVSSRKRYSYPPYRLVKVSSESSKSGLGHYSVEQNGPSQEQWTDTSKRSVYSSINLDEYHKGLLHSDLDDDRLIGLLSVVFWGYVAGVNSQINVNRALAKARMILKGKKNTKPQDINEIRDFLRMGVTHSLKGRFDLAIQSFCDLKFIGPSFASKLVAFSCPERAGILDQVVARKLCKSEIPLLVAIGSKFNGQISSAYSSAYLEWCDWCEEKAAKLNSRGVCWDDWDGSSYPWRSIDVERAVFQLT